MTNSHVGPEPRSEPVPLRDLLAEVEWIALRLRQTGANTDVATGERRLLQLLGNQDGLTVPQLARLRGTSRQNIQVMVNRLAATGYVELSPNAAHKLSSLVSLAAKGKERLNAAANEDGQIEQQLGPHFTEAELQLALAILQRFRQVLAKGHLPVPAPQNESQRRVTDNPVRTQADTIEAPEEQELPVSLL